MTEPSRRSFRQELPDGPPRITAALIVKYARVAWKNAKATGCTDAVGVILEDPKMQRNPRPRVFTAGITTLRGLAALCAVMLANAMTGDGTDDPRLVAAHKSLDEYVRNPPGTRLPR